MIASLRQNRFNTSAEKHIDMDTTEARPPASLRSFRYARTFLVNLVWRTPRQITEIRGSITVSAPAPSLNDTSVTFREETSALASAIAPLTGPVGTNAGTRMNTDFMRQH